MKYKVYTPTVIVLRQPESDGFLPVLDMPKVGTPVGSQREAQMFIDRQVEFYTDSTDNDKRYIRNVVEVNSAVVSHVIDTDDLEVYKPDYEVELEVIVAKRITVTIENDGSIDDEDDAECAARENWENGLYDDDLRYEEVYDSEMNIDSCDEIE